MTDSHGGDARIPLRLDLADESFGHLADPQSAATGEARSAACSPTAGIDSRLLPLFLVLTGDDTSGEWGKQAGQYVRQVRKTTKAGPTFAELFDAILSEQEIWARPFPSASRRLFRLAVATHWRRGHWIRFTQEARSLCEGRASVPFGRHDRKKTVRKSRPRSGGVPVRHQQGPPPAIDRELFDQCWEEE